MSIESTDDERDELRDPDDVRFWRARADELAAQLAAAQARLLALTEVLPARYVPLVNCPEEELQRHVEWPDPLEGWKETTSLEPSTVGSELRRLWARLRHATAR